MSEIFDNVFFEFALIIGLLLLLYKLIFNFKPRNSKEIYSCIVAHRGLHMFYPENTLGAYEEAVKSNLAIELDVRMTKDGKIVCFHDRYTKRLLNIPGKISMFNYDVLKKYRVMNSKEFVPTLEEALIVIDSKVETVVEVKGFCSKKYMTSLVNIQNEYNKELYFHTKNFITYCFLKRYFKSDGEKKKRVFWVCNVFRKRFKFVKGKDYNSEIKKYNELASRIDVEIPSIEDISNIIVNSIEELENKNEILATIGSILNKYETRIKDKNHFVYNSLWLHRGILSNKYLEHSLESFIACKEYAIKNNINMTIEFDVMLYKGEVRCYHKDRISSILGQSKSCAEKLEITNSLRLGQILEIFNGCENINLALDIKDYRIHNRVLEDLIILELDKAKYKGNYIMMSYNPFVLSYFKEVKPDILRAQIGHSLKGLRKVPIFRFPAFLNGILGMLFDMSSSDLIIFDDSKWIFYLIAYHKNIKGKPVIIYAPKTFTEQEGFIGKESIANFIIENVIDENSWPKGYIDKFKRE